MIMMGPKKDRGAMIVSIMEKLKGNGEKVEEFKEEKSDKPAYEEGYKASVNEMFEAIKADDKPKFGKALKEFVHMCMKSEED